MSARSSRTDDGDVDDGDGGGPGAAYTPFVIMDDLLDKLKLLNYDREFILDLRIKPLNR